MASPQQQQQMNFKELFKQLQRERGLATEVIQEALEGMLLAAYKKTPDHRPNAIVRIDPESGTYTFADVRTVVDEIEDFDTEMSLAEAKELTEEAEVGMTLEIELNPPDFGRLAAQMGKQVFNQRLREAERKVVMDQFKSKEGETIIGTVQRLEGRNIIVNFGKVEGIVPGSEQVPGEEYRVGDRIKVFLIEVRETTRGMQLLVSRAHAGLVRELFDLEIPEILDGTVIVEAIAREAGYRTKIAVRSRDASVDPVGACVGARGGRIQSIVSELRNEKIDIIRWSPEPKEFISNALSPAKVVSVALDPEVAHAKVTVPDSQLSLAIGREGQNVRLAARLTGYKIDIKSETQMRDLAAAQAAAEAEADYDEAYPEETEAAPAEVAEAHTEEAAPEHAEEAAPEHAEHAHAEEPAPEPVPTEAESEA